jgi:hypothetical protein
MWNEFEDPDLAELVMVAAIIAIMASAVVTIALHVENTPQVTARAVPAIVEMLGNGR